MEEFFKEYQYTFSAFGTVSTLLAVVISLVFGYRALKANDTKIKAFIGISEIFHEGKVQGSYITTTIINKGLLPVRIPFGFFYIIPSFATKNSKVAMINPMDFYGRDSNVPKKDYPIKIEPNHNEILFLDYEENFVTNSAPKTIKKQKDDSFASWFPIWIYIKFIKIKIVTEDGSSFYAKLSKQLIEKIKDNCESNN